MGHLKGRPSFMICSHLVLNRIWGELFLAGGFLNRISMLLHVTKTSIYGRKYIIRTYPEVQNWYISLR